MPRRTRWLVAFALLVAGGCTTVPSKRDEQARAANPLRVDLSRYDFSKNPGLAEKITTDPYAYFRFINVPFSREVCRRFAPHLSMMPTVNLHGDAHVEQFAVTPRYIGLADFDDSSAGPAVIDLVRFGTSLALTCEERGWTDQTDSVIDAFVLAYRSGIEGGAEVKIDPSLVKKLGGVGHSTQADFLAWTTSLMEPIPDWAVAPFEEGFSRYTELMRQADTSRGAAFFAVKQAGRLRTGIGSGLVLKLLVRIEGDSPAAEDDVILEIKELRDLGMVDCVVARKGDALRVVLGRARISPVVDPFLAVVPRGGDESIDEPPYWVQSWHAGYRELDVHSSIPSVADLIGVARAVGAQLGRGHTSHIASPHDQTLRNEQQTMLATFGPHLRQAIHEMTRATLGAFESIG